jgi:hypothetical protein
MAPASRKKVRGCFLTSFYNVNLGDNLVWDSELWWNPAMKKILNFFDGA